MSNSAAKFGELLTKAWRAYALNRPIYERACSDHNRRLYSELRRSKISKTVDPDSWYGLGDSLRSKMLIKAEQIEEKAYEEVDALVKNIINRKPSTLADLAAFANACATANTNLWEEPLEDLEYPEKLVRKLVEAVVSAADVPLVIADLPLPRPLEQDAFRRISNGQ